ncbi:hypothetical protein ACLOJK_020860 [Asimina triloba]
MVERSEQDDTMCFPSRDMEGPDRPRGVVAEDQWAGQWSGYQYHVVKKVDRRSTNFGAPSSPNQQSRRPDGDGEQAGGERRDLHLLRRGGSKRRMAAAAAVDGRVGSRSNPSSSAARAVSGEICIFSGEAVASGGSGSSRRHARAAAFSPDGDPSFFTDDERTDGIVLPPRLRWRAGGDRAQIRWRATNDGGGDGRQQRGQANSNG